MLAVPILQPKITELEFQVAQLQAQIVAAQSRISVLGEAESVAGGALQALQSAVEKISGLAPDAIANLKSAVLNLFSGNDDQDNGNGNQPINPDPGPDNGGVVVLEDTPEPEQVDDATTVELEHQDEVVSDALEIAAANDVAKEEDKYIEFVQVGDAIAYQYRNRDGEVVCTYIGFKSKTRGEAWGRWFSSTNNIASGFEIREAKRVQGFKHELKLWGLDLDDIERVKTLDLASVPSEQSIDVWIKVEEMGVAQVEEAASPVELPVVQKTHPVIDVTDVPEGVSLLSTNDDRLIEYTCWVWTAAREKGVLAPKQRNVGRLFQTQSGIEAERARSRTTRSKTSQFFERTLDAVNYLIRSSDYRDAIAEGLKLLKSESEVEESESVAVTRAGDIASIATNPDLVKQESLFKEGDLVEINVTRPGNRTWNGLVGYVDGFTASKEVIVALKGNYRKKHFLEDELILIEYGPEQPVEETTVVIQPEVVQVTVEQPEPDSPKFRVNEKVEVISDRKGDELVWQTGVVTAVSSVGCAVDIDGKLYWFCLDEIVSLKDAARIQAEAKADLFPDGE